MKKMLCASSLLMWQRYPRCDLVHGFCLWSLGPVAVGLLQDYRYQEHVAKQNCLTHAGWEGLALRGKAWDPDVLSYGFDMKYLIKGSYVKWFLAGRLNIQEIIGPWKVNPLIFESNMGKWGLAGSRALEECPIWGTYKGKSCPSFPPSASGHHEVSNLLLYLFPPWWRSTTYHSSESKTQTATHQNLCDREVTERGLLRRFLSNICHSGLKNNNKTQLNNILRIHKWID